MILTEHFSICELEPSDAQTLSALMVTNRARFERYFPLTLAQNLTREASKEYIQRKQSEISTKSEFTWALKDKETKTIAGLIILKELDWDRGIGEFAYCLGAKFEGRQWMTEAIGKMTAYAFAELGLRTIQIIAHETNVASTRVAEKCGYVWQRKLMKSFTPSDGKALDMELFECYAD